MSYAYLSLHECGLWRCEYGLKVFWSKYRFVALAWAIKRGADSVIEIYDDERE